MTPQAQQLLLHFMARGVVLRESCAHLIHRAIAQVAVDRRANRSPSARKLPAVDARAVVVPQRF
jgi:hypothetical protein